MKRTMNVSWRMAGMILGVIFCLLLRIIESEELARRSTVDAALEYFEQGNLLSLENSQHGDSLPFYRAAVRLEPTNAEYWVALAKAEFEAKEFKKLPHRLANAKKHGSNEELLTFLSNLWNITFNSLEDEDVFSSTTNVSLIQEFDSRIGNGIWKSPFVFRKFLDSDNVSSTPCSSLELLRSRFGSQKVEFYPQNMLEKPSRVFKVTFTEALNFLDYPEGAYIACDISEPGTYMQWNVPNHVFKSLVPEETLFHNDDKSQLWNSLIQHGNLATSILYDFAPGETIQEKISQAELQWPQLALDKHWNMVLVGEKGAGMFFHTDSLPVGSWQLQLVGSKHWKICPPIAEDKDNASSTADGDLSGCVETVLEPGDLLYYPPYFGHATRCLDSPTISMSSSVFFAENESNYAMMVKVIRDRCRPNTPTVRYSGFLCDWFLSATHLHMDDASDEF